MILYLTEDILNESVNGQTVVDALNNRRAVLINYADENASHTGKRYIEPYVYGVTKAGNDAIRAYQYWGDTKRGVPKWKMFRLDRIESWEPTEETFELEPNARGWAAEAFNKGGDKSFAKIYQIVKLDNEPLTDYEKLKAQNKALKNRKPVNINNIDMSPIKKQQEPVQSGPISTQPTQTTPSPVQPTNNTQSQPIHQNGVESDREQSPIEKEPQTSGPITGNTTNPEENKANDLMSNDEFRKMLQRNLGITNQEKQKRMDKKNQTNLK